MLLISLVGGRALRDSTMRDIPEGAHVSYQFQYRKCGKCAACEQGPGHGPYFYGYWRVPGMRPQSKNMGKILKLDIVQSYFCQVHRISAEDMPVHWHDFKRSTLRASVADEMLTQENLRVLALKCKEKCQRRKKATPTMVPERQTAVA